MKPFNLEEYLANPSRKVVTRNGKAVKIICTNYESRKPVIAEIEGHDYSRSFNKDGRYYIDDRNSLYDLLFSPTKHEGWINIYKWGENYRYTGDVFSSKKKALKSVTGCDNVATIKIEWEE